MTAAADPRELDNYAGLSHKAGLSNDSNSPYTLPKWIPVDQRNRMIAYRILASYMSNMARETMVNIDPEKKKKIREYGDPQVFVARFVAGILGDELGVTFPELDEALSPLPTLDDRPVAPAGVEEPEGGFDVSDELPAEGITLEELRYRVALSAWDQDKRDQIDRWQKQRRRIPTLRSAAEWVEDWIESEQVYAKLHEVESEHVVPMGDGVLVLGWSQQVNRPILRVFPPDSYYPDLTDTGTFPTRVHFVWEVPKSEQSGLTDEERASADPKAKVIRRVTYELLDRREGAGRFAYETGPSGDLECYVTDVTFDYQTSGSTGEQWDQRGSVVEWDKKHGKITENEAGEPLDQFALGFDFLPVVHIPNTPASRFHFGRSRITPVAQLFDDISELDTDLRSAERLAGTPVVGLKGVSVGTQDLKIRPGIVWPLGENGAMASLDLSHSVETLLAALTDKLDRLSVNGQIPKSMLGRLNSAGDFPSGVAIRLTFQSFIQVVTLSRMVRAPKHRLMFKMAQRIALANDVTDFSEVVDVDTVFGEYIPADIAGTAETIVSLLEANGMSRETAVAWLKSIGVPIGDIEDEVARIRMEDTEGAKNAADATGSEDIAASMLGREIDEDTAAVETEPDVDQIDIDDAVPEINLNGAPAADPELADVVN